MAAELRRRVREGLRLTCSCGVAPNRMLAKICSDLNKPDGQAVLAADPAELAQFVSTLPVRKVQGIGRVSACCVWWLLRLAPLLLRLCPATSRW